MSLPIIVTCYLHRIIEFYYDFLPIPPLCVTMCVCNNMCVCLCVHACVLLVSKVGVSCTGKFSCSTSTLCFARSAQCDGVSDCADGEDELQCGEMHTSLPQACTTKNAPHPCNPDKGLEIPSHHSSTLFTV